MHAAWANRCIVFHSRNSHLSTLSPAAAEAVFDHPISSIERIRVTVVLDLIIVSNDHNCVIDVIWVAVSSVIDTSSIAHEVKRVGVYLNHHWSNCHC